jgi:hypothetical protein
MPHCVATEQRTPSAAVAYVLLGHSVADARRDVRMALASTRGWGRVWDAVAGVGGPSDDDSATTV